MRYDALIRRVTRPREDGGEPPGEIREEPHAGEPYDLGLEREAGNERPSREDADEAARALGVPLGPGDSDELAITVPEEESDTSPTGVPSHQPSTWQLIRHCLADMARDAHATRALPYVNSAVLILGGTLSMCLSPPASTDDPGITSLRFQHRLLSAMMIIGGVIRANDAYYRGRTEAAG